KFVSPEKHVIRSGREDPERDHPFAQELCPCRDRPIVRVLLRWRQHSLSSSLPGEVGEDPMLDLALLLIRDEARDDAEPGRPLAIHETTVFVVTRSHRFREVRSSTASPNERIFPLRSRTQAPRPLGVEAMATNDPRRQGSGWGTSRNSGASPK